MIRTTFLPAAAVLRTKEKLTSFQSRIESQKTASVTGKSSFNRSLQSSPARSSDSSNSSHVTPKREFPVNGRREIVHRGKKKLLFARRVTRSVFFALSLTITTHCPPQPEGLGLMTPQTCRTPAAVIVTQEIAAIDCVPVLPFTGYESQRSHSVARPAPYRDSKPVLPSRLCPFSRE